MESGRGSKSLSPRTYLVGQESKHIKAQSSGFEDLLSKYNALAEENKSLRREIETTNLEFSKYKSNSSQINSDQ